MMIRYPVFVRENDSGDMTAYSSVSGMMDYLEQIDVENGEYEAWDAAATRLKLSIRGSPWLVLDEIPGASRPEELSAAITDYARRAGVDVDQTLLQKAQFAVALEKVDAALKERRRSGSWWKKLFGK